jgi:hypothetical protein
MSYIKPKLSSLVAGQLPEFIRGDYQTFVAFLEAYYEFLEANVNTDYKSLKDIDNTLDSFIQYFKHEIAINLPNLPIDERFLLQHIRELYRAKGTEAAFKLLFRILFQKDVVVDYPYNSVLIPSDGKWIQDKSIFVRVSKGTPDLIVGNKVSVITSTSTFLITIKSFKAIDPNISGDTQIVELFYDKDYFNNISENNKIFYQNEFVADVLYTTTKINVFSGGKGFKSGQVYPISSGQGIGSIVKIKSVDSVGAVKTAEFISFGIGYETNFYAYITSDQARKITFSQLPFTLSFSGSGPIDWNATIRDNTKEFIDYGVITRPNYNIDIATPAIGALYVGDVVQTFNNSTTYSSTIIDEEDISILYITIGAEAKYTGYFKTNEGFISDNIYIQDSKYFQKFAYVLKIDEQLSKYESFVKTLVHPTGNALFGEYSITNEFNLNEFVQLVIKSSNLKFDDKVTMSDSHWLHFSKLLNYENGNATYVTTSTNNNWVTRPNGTNGVQFNVALVGREATTSTGSVGVWFQIAQVGKQLTSNFGLLEKYFTIANTGNSVTGSVGQLDKEFDIANTGNSLTLSKNTVTPQQVINLAVPNISSISSNVNTLSKSMVKGLTGYAVTSSVGPLYGGNAAMISGFSLITALGNESVSMTETKSLIGFSASTSIGSFAPSIIMTEQLVTNSASTSIGSVSKPDVTVSISGFGLTSGFGAYTQIINNTLTDTTTPSDNGYVAYNAYIFGPDVYFSDSTEYFEGKTSF